MIGQWAFLGVGLLWLVGLHWVRDRYRDWVEERYPTRIFFGYLAPLLGWATVFLSLGMMWSPDGPQTALSVVLLTCFLLGVVCLAASLAAIWGVRLPRRLLPRWLREDPKRLRTFTERAARGRTR
ncbi:MAG TPA: hypothetical protein PKV13_01375 [Propionicimonas sp.]|nr:hypothetical protein [Propionicimonas sp.]HRA05256.1 hypothetical protein [Propionicimonas sp.]